MFTKFMTGLVAAIILGATAAAPAIGESAKVRAARPAVSQAPIPSSGIRSDGRAHSTNPAYDVYVDGKYAGPIRTLGSAPNWRATAGPAEGE